MPSAGHAEGVGFEESEGLRRLLHRLHAAGPGAWRRDGDAAALMAFAGRRYGRLAAKYGQSREDAAAAAFEAMVNAGTRNAADPWAVVTAAVRITLIAEQRANGLLTSSARARRANYSAFHDAARFSDRDTDLLEYDPAFQVAAVVPEVGASAVTRTEQAGRDAVEFLSLLGWDRATVTHVLEYVCSRLPEFGDRVSGYDGLRRDKTARVLLDLSHAAWIGVVRLLIGNPAAPSRDARRGVLARLLIEETVADLLADGELVRVAIGCRPGAALGRGLGR